MKPEQRYQFIENFLKNDGAHATVDVLHADFVNRYIRATNCKYGFTMIGAHVCKPLQRDLSAMYKLGRLRRNVSGIQGMPWGFPKWVYVYKLPKGEIE